MVALIWAVDHPDAEFTLQVFKEIWPQIFDRLRLAGKLVDPLLADVSTLAEGTAAVLHAQLHPKVLSFRDRNRNSSGDAAAPPIRALTTSPRAIQAVRSRIVRRNAVRNVR